MQIKAALKFMLFVSFFNLYTSALFNDNDINLSEENVARSRSRTRSHSSSSSSSSYSFSDETDRKIRCENENMNLNCGLEKIKIESAIFGRSSERICGNPTLPDCAAPSCTVTNCYSDVTSQIKTQCGGEHSCGFLVSTTDAASPLISLTDPCPGTMKYLTVYYICV